MKETHIIDADRKSKGLAAVSAYYTGQNHHLLVFIQIYVLHKIIYPVIFQ
jgi:hypothetical protein|tara:strand:+ start:1147 stop:1296 length:150 start_codon:yes stop_codon:yes gene_type:complete